MDIKKLGAGIAILGFLVAAYGVYGYLSAGPSSMDPSINSVSSLLEAGQKASVRKNNLPIILWA
jgi:hypothetical protein